MRLLTDSMDSDDNNNKAAAATTTTTTTTTALKSKIRQQHHLHPHHTTAAAAAAAAAAATVTAKKLKTYQTNESLSSDESSINSSPSPTDYVFDIMYGDPAQQQALSMLQFKDFYDPFQQSLFVGMINSGAQNNNNNTLESPLDDTDPLLDLANQQQQPYYDVQKAFADNMDRLSAMCGLPPSPTTPTATSSVTTFNKKKNIIRKTNMKKRKSHHDDTMMMTATTAVTPVIATSLFTSPLIGSETSLWPNYICLYLEYALPYDPCRQLSHNLSQLPHCFPSCLPTISIEAIPKEKCPPITSLVQNNQQTVLLLAKVKKKKKKKKKKKEKFYFCIL
jgi:hypothetical protein